MRVLQRRTDSTSTRSDVQGGGKSYTLGTVIFHYSPTQDYASEFTAMINANSVDEEIRILRERYKANPEALKDVLILTPENKIDDRSAEYPISK